MPTLTADEIRRAIAEDAIGAVSLDTNVFDRFGCDLNVAILRKLDQFNGTHVDVLFSEVVAREVKRHISTKAEETRKRLNGALQDHRKRWEAAYDIGALAEALHLNLDCDETASQQFDAYVAHIGAEIIPVNGHVDIDELTARYFDARPPFEANEKKKYEFPDALALLSLQGWADARKKMVLVVSKDAGWQTFAEHSDCLVSVSDVDLALDHFNQARRLAADGAIAMLRQGAAPELRHEIDAVIQARLDDNDFEVDADSTLSLDWEPHSAVLHEWEFSELAQPRIIAADGETVTFSIDLDCVVTFEAVFGFSVYDSVDKDFVNMGSETLSIEKTVSLTVVATIAREIEPEPVVTEVEVSTQRIQAHFGYIEPDWRDEE